MQILEASLMTSEKFDLPLIIWFLHIIINVSIFMENLIN